MTLVAVDAGGSHTRAAWVGRDGELLGVGVAGPGNPTAVGREAADTAVARAIQGALGRNAGLGGSRFSDDGTEGISGGVVCSAGEQDPARLRSIAAAAGLPPSAQLHLVGDAVAAYLSVADARSGVTLVVGTGAIATRIEGVDAVQVIDGAGWLLGDTGSGFWIGRRVARAALEELDGRGPQTSLTARVLERISALESGDEAPSARFVSWGQGRAEGIDRLMAFAYERSPIALASLADLAFTEAEHDSVAREIVDAGASGVAATLRLARAGSEHAPIAGTGSVLLKGYLSDRLPEHSLSRELAEADLRLSADGLVGAAMLALRRAGLSADTAVRERFASQLRGWPVAD